MKTMISTSTDESTVIAIDEVATSMDITRSDVINEAVRMYLDYITWFKSEVQQGIDDVNAGRVVSHEEAIARFNKILEN